MRPERAPSGLSLIGSRGTGKSTVGRLLAARLRREFVDADSALEAHAGRTIGSIFATDGELVFRDWEERTVAELTGRPGLVLATGGGVVLRASNRQRLRDYGPVVWLIAPTEVLAARLAADASGLAGRPALTAAGTLAELAEVLRVREPLYSGLADLAIDTSARSPEQVVEAILAGLLALGKTFD